jgi:hypothetical protein
VPCALRIGFWPGPLTAGRPAGGSLPGVRGGPGAGRCTLRAVAFDLKAFFAVVQVSPVEVTAADVLGFLAHQRGDRTVVRLADREPGRPARTIARRLSSVPGLYGYLVARGEPVAIGNVSLYRGAGGNALGHGGDRVEESHAGGRGSAGPQAADHARSHREPAEDRAGEQLAHGIAGG